MSLSMVLGIPAIATFRPRRLTSCTIPTSVQNA